MDYSLRLQKFITSQHLNTGIRVTSAVLIPAMVLYEFDYLSQGIGICFGAMFTSLIDNPGPFNHRRNGIIVSIFINFFVVMLLGLSQHVKWLVGIELALLSMFFSLIAVYGSRANAIGAIAIIVFILHLNPLRETHVSIFLDAGYIALGGIWYLLLALTGYSIRPYKQVQLLLGDYLMQVSEYLQVKSKFYSRDPEYKKLYQKLIEHQVSIHQSQNDLRELLFKTRRFLSESTKKGRSLMMLFLDSIDLLERIMTQQQDYARLHKQFEGTDILLQIKNNIIVLGNTLHNIGLAVQSGYGYRSNESLNTLYEEVMGAYTNLRKEKLNAETLESFISLRHILYSLQDITERIKRLETYTSYDSSVNKDEIEKRKLNLFVSSQQFDLELLKNNISLKSNTFRHALRLTIALMIGFIISQMFTTMGHSYWILLTIATIMKPAFSITKKRNFQRLSGTLIGAALGFLILYVAEGHNLAIFITMMVAMLIAYSFLKLQYLISVVAITVYVFMILHFLNPNSLNQSLNERVLDTLIASVIAYLVSSFVLPLWEYQQITKQITKAMQANRDYFLKVASTFLGRPASDIEFKMSRKEAFIALANVSDSFQRMLSEPKEKQINAGYYHQLVSANHVLTSHIAGLSYYAHRFGDKYVFDDFNPIIKQIDRQMDRAICILESEYCHEDLVADKLPALRKVNLLMEQRKKDLNEGIDSDAESVKRVLSDLKTITDQFQLISATTVDVIKVLQKIYGEKKPQNLKTTHSISLGAA